VLIVSTEDSWQHTIVPRLTAAGADLTMVYRVAEKVGDEDDLTLSLPADLPALERETIARGAALVICDPLLSTLGDGIDSHVNRHARAALEPLKKLAERTGAAFIGVAHFNKAGGTDAASRIVASGAFKDVARAILAFARDDEGMVLSQEKNSVGRVDVPSYQYRITGVPVPTAEGIAHVGRFELGGTSERSEVISAK
jgi:hypothetical protein